MTPALFALGGAAGMGVRLAARLGWPLAALEERTFEDGEHKTRPLESVRGRDAIVLAALHGDADRSVNDTLCRLLFFLGSVRDASARSVTALVPYLCYARKDRRTQPRDPVTTRYVACLFEAVGTDCVVTVDVHNLAAFQNAFRCRTEHLEALPLFVEHCIAFDDSLPLAVVAPDEGGVKRADAFRRALAERAREPSFGFMEKHRAKGVVSGEAIVGDLRGRRALILDDLVSTGGTLRRTAEACRRAGAAAVHALATHALPSCETSRLLGGGALDSLVLTNAIDRAHDAADLGAGRVVVLDLVPLLAQATARLVTGGSLSGLVRERPSGW